MRTDELIAELAAKPWPPARPPLRIAGAIVGGWIVALAGMLMVFGSPMQSVALTGAMSFASKLGYPLALAVLAAAAAIAAGRPGQRLALRASLIMLPLAVVAAASATELAFTPSGEWGALFLGTTFWRCLVAVTLASVPILVAMLWAYRMLAPTQLALAGFLAGLSAAAAAATAYALYCPETNASFLIGAYTPAMLVPALIGAIIGPRLLRW
ncbi:MAG: DUF1109 domain-containing protein [Pseudomonadota bacterium]|nr:DUF1109 domain-containing protein [Pseudomonadota bacterium]